MHRHLVAAALLIGFVPLAADAQVIGTFSWRTAPYCNVLTVTVTQNGGTYTLDGFDEQCGGNPRLPIHGIAVPQANGSITIGLSVVNSPGSPLPVNLEASVSPATFSGTWRDSAGSTGTFLFSPGGTSGGPRPGAVPGGGGGAIPNAFALLSDGGFLAAGTFGTGNLVDNGPGTRMMWHPRKAAFRVGTVTGPLWDDQNIGAYSVAFGLDTAAVGAYSAAFGNGSGAVGAGSFAAGWGSTANGFASVAMGDGAFSNGPGSIVLGSFATSGSAEGAFVFGDRSSLTPVAAIGSNTFTVRAGAGVRFYSSSQTGPGTAGVVLASGGGSWIANSDVNLKQHFTDLDGEDVLAKLARMPIGEWSYKAQDDGIRHAGPTAQDFRAAFGLGDDPLGINTTDADGIALRAIQALDVRTRELNETLTRENDELKAALAALRERLEHLERWLVEKR